MYAVIQTGGKQYRVNTGDVIYVEKLDAQPDDTVNFDVLMMGGDDGIRLGKPLLDGASVQGRVIAQGKGKKITVFKYKAKKNIRKTQGHRQPFTKVEITAVNG